MIWDEVRSVVGLILGLACHGSLILFLAMLFIASFGMGMGAGSGDSGRNSDMRN